MDNIIEIGFYLTYVLFAAAAILAVVFPIIHLVGDFKKAKTAFLGIIGLAVILGIGYAMSSGELGGADMKVEASATVVKVVGGGIIATFILIGLTVLAAIYSEVSKFFK